MNRSSLIVVLSLAGAFAGGASADRPCPPDTDCSGAVEINDLLTVINAWGTANPIADVDDSGNVEINDLLAVINTWGPCLFDYGPVFPNAEAHQIALENAAGLIATPANYERIDRDLGLIRTAYPALLSQTHTEAWLNNQLIVGLIQGQDLTEYNCNNVFYRRTSTQHLFTSGNVDYKVLTFDGRFNAVAMSAIYSALPGVSSAEPNGLIGGENFWVPTVLAGGVWRWEIDDGFHDCFDGCDCHRLYVIEVSAAGVVTLISYEEVGQKWCKW